MDNDIPVPVLLLLLLLLDDDVLVVGIIDVEVGNVLDTDADREEGGVVKIGTVENDRVVGVVVAAGVVGVDMIPPPIDDCV